MKKSFTLIELIFVIVIIGLLASFAVPKFLQTYYSAKSSNVKSVVSSLRTAIETKHGENIIDDSATENYPFPLDNAELNKSKQKLFSRVLKNPINSCLSDNCWYKDSNTSDSETYGFKYKDDTTLKFTYYEKNGSIECIDGDNLSAEDCETIINR
jgi:general secretion pathway protein G